MTLRDRPTESVEDKARSGVQRKNMSLAGLCPGSTMLGQYSRTCLAFPPRQEYPQSQVMPGLRSRSCPDPCLKSGRTQAHSPSWHGIEIFLLFIFCLLLKHPNTRSNNSIFFFIPVKEIPIHEDLHKRLSLYASFLEWEEKSAFV